MIIEALTMIPLAGWVPIIMFILGFYFLFRSMSYKIDSSEALVFVLIAIILLIGSFAVGYFWVDPFAPIVIDLGVV